MAVVRRLVLRGVLGTAILGASLGACSDSTGDSPPAHENLDAGEDPTNASADDGSSTLPDARQPDAAPSCAGKASVAPTETAFSLPAGYTSAIAQAVFPAFGGALACGSSNAPQYTMLDLDGDKRLDLVVTRRCNDTATGNTKWLLYRNTGSGFSATPTDFTLPTGYTGGAGGVAFAAIAGAMACSGANTPAYTTADVDGDGRPDLLVTRRCADTTTGTSKWLLYKNTGSGFAAPTDFALPAGYTNATPVFESLAGAMNCNGVNAPEFATFDLDADRRPDLVVMHRCGDASTGNAKWLVYKNNGSGFAAPSDFTLPSGYTSGTTFGTAFGALASTSMSCTSGANAPLYTTTDLDGDGRPDVVVLRRCNDPAIGSSKWLLYKGAAAGFAATATDFTLPSGYTSGGIEVVFDALAKGPGASCTSGANVPVFATLDLDGDARSDLVITRRCNDPATGTSKWLLHKGSASGFAATATDFALPPGYTTGSVGLVFGTLGNATTSCASGANVPAFTTADLDGDGRTDIVVTRRCNDLASGNSKWVLYKNVCTP